MPTLRLSIVLLAVALVGFAPAPFPKKERGQNQDDMVLIQGMWKLLEQGHGKNKYGNTNQHARVKGTTWTFINSGSDGPAYTLTLEQKLSPRAFEWKSSSVFVGSYKIEGRRLTIIYTSGSLQEAQKRPTDFTGPTGHWLIYERE